MSFFSEAKRLWSELEAGSGLTSIKAMSNFLHLSRPQFLEDSNDVIFVNSFTILIKCNGKKFPVKECPTDFHLTSKLQDWQDMWRKMKVTNRKETLDPAINPRCVLRSDLEVGTWFAVWPWENSLSYSVRSQCWINNGRWHLKN